MRNGDTMKSILMISAFLLLPPAAAMAEPSLGKTIQDFTLNDHLGTKYSLDDWLDKQVVVVVFLGTECPLAKLYGNRLRELGT